MRTTDSHRDNVATQNLESLLELYKIPINGSEIDNNVKNSFRSLNKLGTTMTTSHSLISPN